MIPVRPLKDAMCDAFPDESLTRLVDEIPSSDDHKDVSSLFVCTLHDRAKTKRLTATRCQVKEYAPGSGREEPSDLVEPLLLIRPEDKGFAHLSRLRLVERQ